MHFLIVGDKESRLREGTYITILNKAHVSMLGIFHSPNS